MKKVNYLIPLLIALCLFLVQAIPSFASTSSELPPKPEVITMVCYQTTGGSYSGLSIVGELIKKKFDIKLRLIPAANDVARVLMYNSGQSDAIYFATGTHFAMEGLGPFAEINLGPQEYHWVYTTIASYQVGVGVRRDSGIKIIEDVKGKRVAYFVGNPGLNSVIEGTLAFGGLTYDDVELIEFHSTKAGYASVLEGTADVSIMSGNGSDSYKLEASPHGLYWLPKPAEDVEGWKRLNKFCPFVFPGHFTFGAGCSEENPVWGCAYGCNFLVSPDADENLAYWLTKAIHEVEELSWKASDSMLEYNLEGVGLNNKWPYPWHTGSIKYLKEVGLWGPAQEANQQPLIDRQKALAETWEDTLNEAIDAKLTTSEFPKLWLEKRNARFLEFYKPVLFE